MSEDILDQINENIAHAINALERTADSNIISKEKLETDVTEALSELYRHFEDPRAHGITDPDSVIGSALINFLREKVNENLATINVEIEKLKQELQDKHDELLDSLDVKIIERIDKAIADRLSQLDDKINQKISEYVREYIENNLDSIITDEIKNKLLEAVDAAIEEARAKIDAAVQESISDFTEVICTFAESINTILKDYTEKLEQFDNAYPDYIYDAIAARISAFMDEVDVILNKHKQDLGTIE